MANYAKGLATDNKGAPMQEYPAPYTSQTRYSTTNGVASSVVSLNPNTTQLEVGSFGGQGVVIRWVPLTETAAVSPFASVIASGLGVNFDHYVPAGTVRRFVIPKETQGVPTGQVGSINGLYQRVAMINAGITAASILASEF